MTGCSLISVIAESVDTVLGVNVVGRNVRVNGIVVDSNSILANVEDDHDGSVSVSGITSAITGLPPATFGFKFGPDGNSGAFH